MHKNINDKNIKTVGADALVDPQTQQRHYPNCPNNNNHRNANTSSSCNKSFAEDKTE